MRPDRSWMFRRKDPMGRVTKEFLDGVDDFIRFVLDRPTVLDSGRLLCPCAKCRNRSRMDSFWVSQHLYSHGFMASYENWTCHGEEVWGPSTSAPVLDNDEAISRNPYVDMVRDGIAANFEIEDDNLEEDPNPYAQKFYELLRNADEPLWDGCEKHTTLSAVTQLLNLKSEFNMSESCYDRMIIIIKKMLPDSERLPDSFYKTKKMVSELGLGYEKIDACKNHCILYYKEYADLTLCPVCKEPRFKPKKGNSSEQIDVPYNRLRYFPIAPRLKRLYMSKNTAEYMRWHAHGVRQDDSVITHPSDAEAWKKFDAAYPFFAQEVRNIRLGLCTDGFSPYSGSTSTYSCWPVFVTPYNLPPSMCMRREFIFLTLVIPGPKSPGRSLDVYLRPLIDELKILWEDGVCAYDAWKKQNFVLKAMVMWTISDFPAYGMLSGWSTHGKLACPYCMETTCSFVLKHGKKCSWFDCHRQFLPLEHPYRRDRNSFTKLKQISSLPPKRLSGEEVRERVDHLQEVVFGLLSPPQKQLGFGKDHNWVKRSIFWELPYWSTNLIRHNLDVMHVEKNVFDNIFNTIMDVKGKTKDNANAREDLKLVCKRPNLELVVENDKIRKPKAAYVLDANERKIVCEWIKQLKFPDGYASNITKCVNEDGKIFGMKSHDCHVFMQRLLPLAFRDILIKQIWEPLAELSVFFQELCATKIRLSTMEIAELSIAETLCKLEKIFPPAFFDVMEHLVVHLPYEAKVGGPVQYRWMYPFERCMLYLKRKVHNKARVEGSICESYIVEEISNFTSMYFEPYLQTRRTKVPRNDDGGELNTDDSLSIFKHPCRPIGRSRNKYLTERDYLIVETYILVNCIEVKPYLEQFEESLRITEPEITEDEILSRRDNQFSKWLKSQVKEGKVNDVRIRQLSYGPTRNFKSYNGIVVNGYRFQTKEYGQHQMTMNSGVCCRGSLYGENELDYYGIIEEVLQLSYMGFQHQVFVLRCQWFDPENGVRYDSKYKLIDIKHRSKLQSYEPFILAEQAQQVYYMAYPAIGGRRSAEWWAASKVRARLFYAETIAYDGDGSNNNVQDTEYYQEDETSEMQWNATTRVEHVPLLDEHAPMEEVLITEIYIPLNFEVGHMEQVIADQEYNDNDDNPLVEDANNNQLESDSESE